MTATQIRALGFDWPGSESVEQYAVERAGQIDLAATLEALRRGLDVYQRELDDMHGFQRKYNADWGDVTDRRGAVATKVSELRGIELVESIRKRAS